MNENEVVCERMCRACLGSGRLYSIHDCQLADSYNQLIGTKVLPCDGLPQDLCAVCSIMLLKYREFKNQCLEVLLILDDIKKRHNLITSDLIPEDLKFHRRCSRTVTKIAEYPQTNPDKIIDNRGNLYTYHGDVKPIKNEIEIYIDNISMKIDGNTTDNSNSQIFTEEVYNDEINGSVPEFIKVDNQQPEKEENNTDLEEINIKATKKSKNKKCKLNPAVEKEIKRSKNKNKKEIETKICKFKRAAKINKIKGKYFETKENMSNFEAMFDVEIMILSREQQLSDVMDRKTSQNYINSPFKCENCYKGFIDEDNLAKHFKSQHDLSRGDVTCEFCQYRYRDKRGLNQHLKSHRLKFVCSQCGYVSRTTYNAKEHYKMHRGLMHECKDCGKSYEKLSTYLTHMRVHHPAELAWCDLCGEPFIGEFGLNGHKKRAHRDLKFPSDCACACGARFTNRTALEQHHSHGCGLTPCSLCGISFTNRMSLKDHLLEKHRRVKKYYTCAKSHSRVHSNDRPYACKLCPKTFKGPSALRGHEYMHTGGRTKNTRSRNIN